MARKPINPVKSKPVQRPAELPGNATGSHARELTRVPIAELVPFARNARTHSDDQIAQLAASIREFGWTNPVLLQPDMTIIAGHGRVLAARKLGLTEVPGIVIGDLTPAQIRALVLADNKLALNAGWDEDLLASELLALRDEGFDLDLTGFGGDELAELFAEPTEGLTDPEETPTVPVKAVTVAGDVWLLGKHRLVCGDSTRADDVAKALNGRAPHLMVTDPPYGVEYDASWRADPVQAGKGKGAPGGKAFNKVLNDDRADWREAWALFPGDVGYVWHAALKGGLVAESLAVCGFDLRAQIVWAKQHFAIGRGDYHWQHEPCWYAVRKGKPGQWDGDRKQTTLWEIEKPQKSETGHSTQKPVECMQRPMLNNSKPGDAIYEPFSGSGSTIIAAEMIDRRACALELNPAYVDVAVLRWQQFTGKDAILESTGRTWAETATERGVHILNKAA